MFAYLFHTLICLKISSNRNTCCVDNIAQWQEFLPAMTKSPPAMNFDKALL